MLKRLTVENFKNFGSVQEVPLAPITLIYGPNSAGKSSILKLLALMRQSFHFRSNANPKLTPQGPLVDLGTFKSLIHNHDLKRTLKIKLQYELSGIRPLVMPRRLSKRQVSLDFRAPEPSKKLGQLPVLESLLFEAEADSSKHPEFCVGFRHTGYSADEPETSLYKLFDDESVKSLVNYLSSPVAATKFTDGIPEAASMYANLEKTVWEGNGISLSTSRPNFMAFDSEVRIASQLFSYFAREIQTILGEIRSLGPLRIQPSRYYTSLEGSTESVGSRGEHTPKALSDRKWLLRTIDKWFKKFDIPYKLKIRDIGDVSTGTIIAIDLIDQRTDIALSLADVGFGIGQLLPILVEGLLARTAVVCVEQPEIHLHPRLQAHLADFFIETSIRPDPRASRPPENQWIIETHSEALMLRLQRRIAEKVIPSNSVSVLYVKPSADGSSVVKTLRLDDQGEFIDEWPDGFFEETYDEVFNR